ncbi:hypothetical protein ACFTWF_32515 [Rhodococcus sp. NPDC056960]|uniref:hypothetical protein n=1 Tax=Rhodococcus sp. NPDC056960 TaxID=3345982 RepID=UPI00363B7858
MSDDHLYIPRHTLKLLATTLREIPELCIDLEVALTKQDRLSMRGGNRKPKRPSEQPLPYSEDASEAGETIHRVLSTWVRLVCEHRGVEYAPIGYEPGSGKSLPPGYNADNTPGLAKWLNRHLISLAMTEGSESAVDEILDAVEVIRRIIWPRFREPDNASRTDAARATVLNQAGIASVAKELGDEYRHLGARRVKYLCEQGYARPAPGPWRPDWPTMYVVGDVMDAHLAHPIRPRHTKESA